MFIISDLFDFSTKLIFVDLTKICNESKTKGLVTYQFSYEMRHKDANKMTPNLPQPLHTVA